MRKKKTKKTAAIVSSGIFIGTFVWFLWFVSSISKSFKDVRIEETDYDD